MPLELPNIGAISLDSASLAIMDDTHQLARKVNEFRPLSEPTLSELRRRLLTEEVYHSNAIEGSTLSLRETAEILATGELYLDKQREAQEAMNLMHAIRQVESLQPNPGAACDLNELLETHRLILTSVNDAEAGHLRNHSVMIRGAKYQPPDAEAVHELMTEFLNRLSQSGTADPLLRAAWVHWTLARIHPFGDGNGRMARLWQNLVLFQGHLTAALIRSSERKEYYEALQYADGGEFNPLVQFVARSCQMTLQEYLNAQQAVDELKDWAKTLIDPATIPSAEELTLQYTRWALRMESLRDAFERCAAQLTEVSNGTVSITLNAIPILSREDWEALWTIPTARTRRFFEIQFQRGRGKVAYSFHFHQSQSGDSGRTAGEAIAIAANVLPSKTSKAYRDSAESVLPWDLIPEQSGFILVTPEGGGVEQPLDAVSVAKHFLTSVYTQVLR